MERGMKGKSTDPATTSALEPKKATNNYRDEPSDVQQNASVQHQVDMSATLLI